MSFFLVVMNSLLKLYRNQNTTKLYGHLKTYKNRNYVGYFYKEHNETEKNMVFFFLYFV